jgi:hypothetical protein
MEFIIFGVGIKAALKAGYWVMTRQAEKRALLSHIPAVLHVTERELKTVKNRCQEFHRQYQYQKYEYNSQKHVVLLGQGDDEYGKVEVYHEPP